MLSVELDLVEPPDGLGAPGGFALGFARTPMDAELLHSGQQWQTGNRNQARTCISSIAFIVSHHISGTLAAQAKTNATDLLDRSYSYSVRSSFCIAPVMCSYLSTTL